jgi:hypothetical protein
MSPILDSIGSVKGYGWGTLLAVGNFESLATATGTGSEKTITFSSIPSTYTHLQIRFAQYNQSSIGGNIRMRFNGDSGSSSYNWNVIQGVESPATFAAARSTTQGSILVANYYTAGQPSYPTFGIIDITDYSITSKFKSVKSHSSMIKNVVADSSTELFSGTWKSTSAITSITLFSSGAPNWNTSTKFALYGIK